MKEIELQLARLDERLNGLEVIVNRIDEGVNNHLTETNNRIGKIDDRIWGILILALTQIITFVYLLLKTKL